MAADSPGDVDNAEWGFTPDDSSVATVAATSAGFIEGDIDVSVPREYNFIRLDQVRVELAGICVLKGMMASFGFGECLLGNLQNAWDNDAEGGGVITVDDDMRGTAALLLNTNPPNDTGNDTRVVSVPTALAIGDGAYRLGNSGKQTIGGMQWKAIADSNQLLGTVTDTYNA